MEKNGFSRPGAFGLKLMLAYNRSYLNWCTVRGSGGFPRYFSNQGSRRTPPRQWLNTTARRHTGTSGTRSEYIGRTTCQIMPSLTRSASVSCRDPEPFDWYQRKSTSRHVWVECLQQWIERTRH